MSALLRIEQTTAGRRRSALEEAPSSGQCYRLPEGVGGEIEEAKRAMKRTSRRTARVGGGAATRIDFASVRPVKSYRVQVSPGVSISVQEWGTPDGPEIVFIHGFLQSHLAWWNQVTDSTLRTMFRMVTFDLPGHGGSDKPCTPAVFDSGAHYAETLAAAIAGSGLRKPVLVGWSYGTRVVCDYLIGYSDSQLSGINFVGSSISSDPDLRGPGFGFSEGVLSEELVPSLEATRAFNHSCFHTPPSAADLDQLTAISMMVPSTIRRWMNRPVSYQSVLAAIVVPVLVTHGLEDQIVRPGLADYVATTVPHGETSYYRNVGHSVFWEAPDRFNRELTAFVRRAT